MRKLKSDLFFVCLTNNRILSVVWENCIDQEAHALEKLQNVAARLVTGLTSSVSLDKSYRECG